MLFHEDLDVRRGQSFRETHGDLRELMSEARFARTSETLPANGVAAGCEECVSKRRCVSSGT